ncbi:MAG: class I SAM-dependent methyltransferase [Bacteroidetes bacterium]|nr:class I SAM-dependent methyltransferase [Bacteroidota bacterium]
MENVKNKYTEFHLKKASHHLYPTEWVIRTMLGTYPNLKLDKTHYNGGKILDLGFGDGRNLQLLRNCGLKVYGVEITPETIALGKQNIEYLNVEAELRVGSNSNIPFEDSFFDYILASSSCYYLDNNSSFDDNLNEISRVMKKGATLIANFPAFIDIQEVPVSFILKDSIALADDHVIIKGDIYGLRNGYKFKTFSSEQSIHNYFSRAFENISVGVCMDNYYGVQINHFIVTAQKK